MYETTERIADGVPFLRFRLSLMMFLQYAIWGAWLPILFPFLLGHRHFTLDQAGAIFSAGAIGAILGPFIAGQLADRSFATERMLAVSHFIGAILVWYLASTDRFEVFLVLSLIYGLVYAPTLALTNSLAFAHLKDRDRDFGPVRLWGTIGWIAAGIFIGQLLLRVHTPVGADDVAIAAAQNAGRADAFVLSSALGAIMAIYCLTLPHTPPTKNAKQKVAFAEAISEIRVRPLLVLFLLAVPVSIVHQFYFVHTSQFVSLVQNQSAGAGEFAKGINEVLGVGGGGLMTVGQMTELVVLALMPFLATSLSRKTLLGIGLAAYAARMALFAYQPSIGPVIAGIAMHGLCFGCFIFVAFMIVDERTSKDVRATAQNLFNLVIIGIGIIVGSWFATSIVGRYATNADETTDYAKLFSVPMWMAIACLAVLIAAYPGGRNEAAKER